MSFFFLHINPNLYSTSLRNKQTTTTDWQRLLYTLYNSFRFIVTYTDPYRGCLLWLFLYKTIYLSSPTQREAFTTGVYLKVGRRVSDARAVQAEAPGGAPCAKNAAESRGRVLFPPQSNSAKQHQNNPKRDAGTHHAPLSRSSKQKQACLNALNVSVRHERESGFATDEAGLKNFNQRARGGVTRRNTGRRLAETRAGGDARALRCLLVFAWQISRKTSWRARRTADQGLSAQKLAHKSLARSKTEWLL